MSQRRARLADSKRTSALRLWLPLVMWAGIIFATSCTVIRPQELFSFLKAYILPNDAAVNQFKMLWASIWIFVVKGWHFTEFAILQVLCTRAIDWLRSSTRQTSTLFSAAICVAFAASDEWHQTFVPDRFGTTWDALVDSLGVLSVCWWQCQARRP